MYKINNNQRFGLYLGLGIEANNFILSGFASKLKEENINVIALTNYDSYILDNLLSEYSIDKINICKYNLKQKIRNKIEDKFLSSRRAKLRLNGITPIGWKGNFTKKRNKDYLIGNSLVYSYYKYKTLNENNEHYFDKSLAKFFKEQNITDIVLQSYSAPDVMTLGITANKIGIKVWLMNWGWKDFYINEFIPFSVNGFFTWSEKYLELYKKYNQHLKKGIFYSFGNIGFDSFWDYKPKKELKFYLEKYNLEENTPIVLYTMMNPDVYDKEINIIKSILDGYKDNSIDVSLLLKPNPMDNDTRKFDFLFKEYNNLSVTENLWLYDKEHNFNLMTKEAKEEWMDLLYYCNFTMNVASTVTVESLIMKKPVLNIGFGASKKDNAHILAFGNSDYYKDLFLRDDVNLAKNLDEIYFYSKKYLKSKFKQMLKLNDFLVENNNATKNVVDIILKG